MISLLKFNVKKFMTKLCMKRGLKSKKNLHKKPNHMAR